MLTGIAADQPFDTNENASTRSLVFERVDPLRILIGLLYSHRGIVAHKLHMSMKGACKA